MLLVSVADAVARIAGRVSARFDGPYHAAKVITISDAVYDDGGSIIMPGSPVERDCICQVDAVTEAMRSELGFTEKDVRLLIMSLVGDLDTDATVKVIEGPHVGVYSVQSVGTESFGIYRECRGRPA